MRHQGAGDHGSRLGEFGYRRRVVSDGSQLSPSTLTLSPDGEEGTGFSPSAPLTSYEAWSAPSSWRAPRQTSEARPGAPARPVWHRPRPLSASLASAPAQRPRRRRELRVRLVAVQAQRLLDRALRRDPVETRRQLVGLVEIQADLRAAVEHGRRAGAVVADRPAAVAVLAAIVERPGKGARAGGGAVMAAVVHSSDLPFVPTKPHRPRGSDRHVRVPERAHGARINRAGRQAFPDAAVARISPQRGRVDIATATPHLSRSIHLDRDAPKPAHPALLKGRLSAARLRG